MSQSTSFLDVQGVVHREGRAQKQRHKHAESVW